MGRVFSPPTSILVSFFRVLIATNTVGLTFSTDTLILQLGYILSSVPAWRKAFKLRVLVFVEYENEVEEETARVKALLDKLRIDAETHVFWLACGELHTYECIINGRCDDIETEIMVNDTLRDEDWWDELQRFRGRPDSMNASQEMNSLAAILDATSGRPGVYNPHADMEELARRRTSIVDLPSRPSMVRLSRLGVHVGIHTHHLADEVFEEQIDQLDHPESDIDMTDEDSPEDSDTERGWDSAPSDAGGADTEPSTRPLLGTPRRKSVADVLAERQSVARKSKSKAPGGILEADEPSPVSYGTMGSETFVDGRPALAVDPGHSNSDSGRKRRARTGRSNMTPSATPTPTQSGQRTPETVETVKPLLRASQEGGADIRTPTMQVSYRHSREPSIAHSFGAETPTPTLPVRPNMSRQSSAVRFTSRPMPETKTNVEDHQGPTIMFAETVSAGPAAPQSERPAFSRQSSAGRFNSRLTTDQRLPGEEGQRNSLPGSRHHSRKGSAFSDFRLDQRVDIPELLGSYRFDPPKEGSEEGSSYSTQSIALSFNDLPSRAQHLILNELMRRNSADTALTLTTLPVPSDGTSLDEGATLGYLSDVEVLCNDLPPVLLMLSNSMTVTVGL